MAEIRAAQLQEDLVALAVLGDEVARLVLADVPTEVLARIRDATRVAWLPVVEVNEPLLRAIRAHAGDEGLRDFALAYRATFRGMGELSIASSAPHLVGFALRGLPPEVERDQFVLVLAGAIESALAHAQVIGRVDVLAGEGDADAYFHARWPAERPVTARPFAAVPDAALVAEAAATERTGRPTQARG